MNESEQSNWIMKAAGIGIVVIAAVLIFGTWWTGQSAQRATEEAVHSVSTFYLDELTGRREQVVATNLNANISNMQTALDLMTEEDLSDIEHLQAFQARMKQLYSLEKFAFVDNDGLIYTSQGMQDNIDEYDLNYLDITGPEISVKGLGKENRQVIIAMPLDNIPFNDNTLVAAFMEIDMQIMIDGLSLQSDTNETTFCNLYTDDGVALTNMVLGGLAREDNLLDALKNATFEPGSSYAQVENDFKNGNAGVATFNYNGIQETLDYVPVPGHRLDAHLPHPRKRHHRPGERHF